MDDDEPVCVTCRKSDTWIEARRAAEFYYGNDWYEIFKGVKP